MDTLRLVFQARESQWWCKKKKKNPLSHIQARETSVVMYEVQNGRWLSKTGVLYLKTLLLVQ